jgi:fused signal recognition particle receptor
MNFFKSLVQKFAGKPVDWDELEETLIRTDIGVPMAIRILNELRDRATYSVITANDVEEIAREEILEILPASPQRIEPLVGKPKVILVVGVNGTGKTTSTAKLAQYFLNQHQTVLLAAADTFRAAAIEQLGIWAERLGVEMIRGQYHADPAALCFEAYQAAVRQKAQFLLCDTAGRLHTKSNLMAELNKVKRSIAKSDADAPQETLLVVDATTGSNAVAQAREFHQAIGLTGVIVTKLDGSGKGGVVIAIQNELGIPTRFIGTGEQLGDLAPFDSKKFVESIL